MDPIFMLKNWETLANYALYRFRHQKPWLAALKGLRNGIVYGAKIRAPHALVMVFLFSEGSFTEKLWTILRLTKTHAINLATFVFAYKLICAFLVGHYVFGENNAVNMQINMYLLSRIIFALAKLSVKRGVIEQPKRDVFPWFAAITWGLVLWLFEHHPDTLHGGLARSMTYLYHDSNVWSSVRDFLIRNSDKEF